MKLQYPFNPDTYLGHRGADELQTVTGMMSHNATRPPAAIPSSKAPVHVRRAGNRLWEWFSVGRYGLGGYDVKGQTFQGDAWPKACWPPTPYPFPFYSPTAQTAVPLTPAPPHASVQRLIAVTVWCPSPSSAIPAHRETGASMQEVDEDWRRTALGFQEKVHGIAVKLLKAIFIGLGRDASIIDEACSSPLAHLCPSSRLLLTIQGDAQTCCMLGRTPQDRPPSQMHAERTSHLESCHLFQLLCPCRPLTSPPRRTPASWVGWAARPLLCK